MNEENEKRPLNAAGLVVIIAWIEAVEGVHARIVSRGGRCILSAIFPISQTHYSHSSRTTSSPGSGYDPSWQNMN